MNSKYGDISNDACYNYTVRLIDKLFKIIPLKEVHSPTVDSYIEDLIYELCGNNAIFEETEYNPKLVDIISILEAIKNEDMTHKEYRRSVFKCITITEQLKEYMSGVIDDAR